MNRSALFVLCGVLASFGVHAQAAAAKVPTHCKADERVIFSCPFKHGKTASLCASPDLTRDTGILEYRYGVIGKPPELIFPQLHEEQEAEPEARKRKHPKIWFRWLSFYSTPMPTGSLSYTTNNRWSTKDVPPGDSVSISLRFTPLEDHPELHFVIDAMSGPDSRYQGSILAITELVGRGRTVAEYRCIKEKTIEDLFFLKDILQK